MKPHHLGVLLAVIATAAFGTSHARAAVPAAKATATPSPEPTPTSPFQYLKWRSIGPALPGGRVTAVAGSARDQNLYYVGSAGGGVWKSDDGGYSWEDVFSKEPVAAIGAVAIDPTNDDVVYVGTGEANPRNDVSYGNGIYKTTDGGKTWLHLGLDGTRHISRILIDPQNPNVVLVGALGSVTRDSTDRGVYRSTDGGKTWTRTLYVGPQSGISDMAMDPKHPNVVYAGVWQVRRKPWELISGGPQDGLYKSTDGGITWMKLEGHGLPSGLMGRIGLAVAPSNPNVVYAMIQSKEGLLWRSDDGGATWKMMTDNTLVDQRPFYFTHVAVDPANPYKVYAVSELLSVSTDGGKTFKPIARDVHVDYHAIWIAPNDPKRIIVGEDGGYALTTNGGKTWSFSRNLPIGQLYHVGLSLVKKPGMPYLVCGGWQDNNGWCEPSYAFDPSGITSQFVISVVGGDGEWAVPEPDDSHWIWADSENGALVVFNRKTYDGIFAQPYFPNGEQSFYLSKSKYRFNWDAPIAFAPWNPHVAWLGANVVFQTTDRGKHWTVISPDLTLNDKAHQGVTGGPITADVSGAEYSDTLLDIEGSPVRKGEIWVGTDDGLVQLTLDGGKHWKNVTPPGVPPFGRVETVAPSPFDAGTAYANIDRHRSGDEKPYLFVTHDYGKTWTSIASGLPQDTYVRTVRPDIRNPQILYVGTELGIYVSFDGGKTYWKFNNNIPAVSVRDIRIQPQYDDLVIGTHGRDIWVFDDLAPIQGLSAAMQQGSMLFAPRVAYEYNTNANDEGLYTRYAGENPPNGVIIDYYQKTASKTPLSIQILNARGAVVRTISGSMKIHGKETPRVPNHIGLNRYVWNFTAEPPVRWNGALGEEFRGPEDGPQVPPGTYTVRMTLDGKTYTQRFVVKPDPRTHFTQADFEKSYAFAEKYMHEFSNVDVMLNTLDGVKKQLDAARTRADKKGDTALTDRIAQALREHDVLFDTLTANYRNDEDSIQRPGKLREDMGTLLFTGQGYVTPAMEEYGKGIDARYRDAVARFDAYVASLKSLDGALQAAGLKPLTGISPITP